MSIISESPWENGSGSTLKSTSKPRIEDELSLISTKINGLGRGYGIRKKIPNTDNSSTTTSIVGLGRGRGLDKGPKALPARPGWLRLSIPSTSGEDPFGPFEESEFSEFEDKISIE